MMLPVLGDFNVSSQVEPPLQILPVELVQVFVKFTEDDWVNVSALATVTSISNTMQISIVFFILE